MTSAATAADQLKPNDSERVVHATLTRDEVGELRAVTRSAHTGCAASLLRKLDAAAATLDAHAEHTAAATPSTATHAAIAQHMPLHKPEVTHGVVALTVTESELAHLRVDAAKLTGDDAVRANTMAARLTALMELQHPKKCAPAAAK